MVSRFARVKTSGIAIAAAAVYAVAPSGAPVFMAAATAFPRVAEVQLTGFLFGDGTQTQPNAGSLFGNGYSYTAADDAYCESAARCDGGNGGLVIGNGDSGWDLTPAGLLAGKEAGNGGKGGAGGRGGLGGRAGTAGSPGAGVSS